jgi:hypothetical protein
VGGPRSIVKQDCETCPAAQLDLFLSLIRVPLLAQKVILFWTFLMLPRMPIGCHTSEFRGIFVANGDAVMLTWLRPIVALLHDPHLTSLASPASRNKDRSFSGSPVELFIPK